MCRGRVRKPVNDRGLRAVLERIVGSDGVIGQSDAIGHGEAMGRYVGDALGAFRAFGGASRLYATPGLVALQPDTQHVACILRYAQKQQIPGIHNRTRTVRQQPFGP